MLTERYDIDAIRAFELLAQLSQEANTKQADIAPTRRTRPPLALIPHGPHPDLRGRSPECVGALLNRRIQAADVRSLSRNANIPARG